MEPLQTIHGTTVDISLLVTGQTWYIKSNSCQSMTVNSVQIMEKLSCVELGRLLEEKGLSEVAEAFIDNDVNGECLVELTELEVKELAPKIGDRVKLRRLISQHQVAFYLV